MPGSSDETTIGKSSAINRCIGLYAGFFMPPTRMLEVGHTSITAPVARTHSIA